jgi:hypothetical protein
MLPDDSEATAGDTEEALSVSLQDVVVRNLI